MNARTIMITVGAVAALAAPGLANARILPAGHGGKHPAKPLVTPKPKPRPPVYLYYPAPLVAQTAATTDDSSTSSVDTSTMDDPDDC